jgi:hypothetical protein
MKTDIETLTILSYPKFQHLPKGVKQLLLFSESYFFDLPAAPMATKPPFWCARQVSRAVRAPIGAASPLAFCNS